MAKRNVNKAVKKAAKKYPKAFIAVLAVLLVIAIAVLAVMYVKNKSFQTCRAARRNGNKSRNSKRGFICTFS